ncbi:MAG: hypothetical protein NTY23_08245 [Chloroflexi bacterium]|nr:hypothetical protein [Chloroflexota bacterium]
MVKDDGNNIAMRGMLPAQLLIVLGAVAWVDSLHLRSMSRGYRVLLAYAAIVLLGSTAMATLFEIDYFARPGIGTSGVQLGRFARLFPASRQLPEGLTYLRWVNAETPRGALLVEPDAQVGDARYWLLQRVRYLGPESLAALEEAAPDAIYHMPSQVATEKHDGAEDLIRQALASKYVRENVSSVYVVWRSPESLPIEGELVYSDATVRIFRVDIPAISGAGLPTAQ